VSYTESRRVYSESTTLSHRASLTHVV